MVRTSIVLVFALLTGCPPATDGTVDTGDSGGTDSGDTDSGDSDSGGDSAVSPCSSGDWGLLGSPGDAIHVRADGSATGSGAASDAVDSVAAALTIARDEGAHAIFVGPGRFTTNVETDTRDEGLRLLGCGAESILDGGAGSSPVLTVAGTAGLVVDSLQLSGGRRSLFIWQGAEATISEVSLINSRRAAVLVDGELTSATLTDVSIASVTAESVDPGVAFGIVVQDATLSMTRGGIGSATGVGLLAQAGRITLDDVDITGTLSRPDGTLGRAIHVQELARATIRGGSLTFNADAAIFALRASSVDVSGVTIKNTGAAVTPDGAPTGDGIVVTAGESSFDPGSFVAKITGCTITDSARAPILVAGASVEATDLSGNTFTDNGYEPDGKGVIVQDSAAAPTETGYYDIDSEGVAPLDTNDGELSKEDTE